MTTARETPQHRAGHGGGGTGTGSLSIGELAERTGVSSVTLRSWERRLGFPVPLRTVGGQRRYLTDDVERVRRVLAERDRGLTLKAAVESVARDEPAPEVGSASLYAALRAAHPQLDPIRVSRRVMQALTWSIEDECLAHATRPLLLGGFQDVPSYRRAGRRWRELARTAERAVVFSGFADHDLGGAPAQVALPQDSPMLNEWSVVCLDAQLSVVLVAWEPPLAGERSEPQDARRFEGLLSLEPDVVRSAAAHLGAVAADLGAGDLVAVPARPAAGSAEDAGRTASLLRRFATYADR